MGRASVIVWEFGDGAKASSTSVHTVDLDNTNIVAQLAAFADFRDAIEATVVGNMGAWEVVAADGGPGKDPADSPLAQRENKWLVSFTDNVNGNPGSFTIPCADLTLLGADGENMAAGTERTALVDATEAYVRSVTGNAVTVSSIKFRAYTI